MWVKLVSLRLFTRHGSHEILKGFPIYPIRIENLGLSVMMTRQFMIITKDAQPSFFPNIVNLRGIIKLDIGGDYVCMWRSEQRFPQIIFFLQIKTYKFNLYTWRDHIWYISNFTMNQSLTVRVRRQTVKREKIRLSGGRKIQKFGSANSFHFGQKKY